MPVSAVTLNNDGIVGKFEVNHKLVEHNHLFIKSNTVLFQGSGHCVLYIGALARGEALQVAKYAVCFAAILAPPIAGRIGFKLFAAVVADYSNFRFPFWVTLSLVLFADFFAGTFLRAISLHLSNGRTDGELFAATLAGFSNKLLVLMNLFSPVASIATFGRAKLGVGYPSGVSQELLATFAATNGNTVDRHAFVAAKMILTRLYLAFKSLEDFATSKAFDNDLLFGGHKETSCQMVGMCA